MPQSKLVRCPGCKFQFRVQLDGDGNHAEAILRESKLADDAGHDQSCPKCGRQLFIRYS